MSHIHEWTPTSTPFFYTCKCGEFYIWVTFIGDHPCPRCDVMVPDGKFHYCNKVKKMEDYA